MYNTPNSKEQTQEMATMATTLRTTLRKNQYGHKKNVIEQVTDGQPYGRIEKIQVKKIQSID